MNIRVFRPDGTSRAIWSKPYAGTLRRHGVMPVRGSHVIAVTEGAGRGLFHVDFSPLADMTRDDTLRVCLTQLFESHEEAVAAEHAWLIHNWVGQACATGKR